MDPATISALVKLAIKDTVRKAKKVIDMFTKPDETISKLIIYGIIIPLFPLIIFSVLICGIHSGVNGYVDKQLEEFTESILYVRIKLVENYFRKEVTAQTVARAVTDYIGLYKEEKDKEEEDTSEEESSSKPPSKKVSSVKINYAEIGILDTNKDAGDSNSEEEDSTEDSSELTEEEKKELFEFFNITFDIQVPNLAHTLAYITHADEIDSKRGNIYFLEEEDNSPTVFQILSFYRKVNKFEIETYIDADGVEWVEYINKPISPMEIGNMYWPEDTTTAQMYNVSYQRFCEAYDIPCETYNLRNVEMDVPLEFQTGNYTKYGSSTISKSGCGPTCLAMVLSYLKGTTISANDIVDWCGGKYYIPDKGTSWSIFPDAALEWGCNCEQVSDFAQVVEALNARKPVIASMGPGHFTSSGHFIVIRGSTSDGYLLVNDPNKNNNSQHNGKVPADWVINEAKGYFIFSGGTESE